MDTNRKLQQYLPILGFSLLMALANVSCKYNIIAEYSFLNKLDSDVELLLYMSGDPFEGKVSNQYVVPSGEYVKFVTLQTDDREGFGARYFIDRVDSAKLRIAGEESYIAEWFSSGSFKYANGYETLPDFFRTGNWSGPNIIQHGGSHAEYRFTLKLQEER